MKGKIIHIVGSLCSWDLPLSCVEHLQWQVSESEYTASHLLVACIYSVKEGNRTQKEVKHSRKDISFHLWRRQQLDYDNVPLWTVPSGAGLRWLRLHFAWAGHVGAVGQCVGLVCATPHRSGRRPATLRWTERRRTPRMSTPRRQGLQSCTWSLHGRLTAREKCEELAPYRISVTLMKNISKI